MMWLSLCTADAVQATVMCVELMEGNWTRVAIEDLFFSIKTTTSFYTQTSCRNTYTQQRDVYKRRAALLGIDSISPFFFLYIGQKEVAFYQKKKKFVLYAQFCVCDIRYEGNDEISTQKKITRSRVIAIWRCGTRQISRHTFSIIMILDKIKYIRIFKISRWFLLGKDEKRWQLSVHQSPSIATRRLYTELFFFFFFI